MFSYPCPGCQQQLMAPRERSGQKTICPKCLNELTIPRPEGPPADDEDPMVDFSVPPPTPHTDVNTPLPRSGRVPRLNAEESLAARLSDLSGSAPAAEAHGVREISEAELQPLVAAVDACVAAAPTPPTRTARPFSRKPHEDTAHSVILNPTGLFAVDAVAELSAALSMRMKPPPEPPTDLRLTTGGLLLATAGLLTVWVSAVLYTESLIPHVALLAGAIMVFGYLWQSYVAGLGGAWLRAFAALLPPVAVWRFLQRDEKVGRRPLLFVIVGLAGLGLYVLAPATRAAVNTAFGVAPVDPKLTEPETPLSQLRQSVRFKQYDSLAQQLRELAQAEARRAVPPHEHTDLAREVAGLTQNENRSVRESALVAGLEWCPRDCREAVARSLRSPDWLERQRVYPLVHRCPHPEVLGLLADHLQDRDDRRLAAAALVRVGSEAEASILGRLESYDELAALVACEVLGQIGGQRSIEALQKLQIESDSKAVRSESERRAAQIIARLLSNPGAGNSIGAQGKP